MGPVASNRLQQHSRFQTSYAQNNIINKWKTCLKHSYVHLLRNITYYFYFTIRKQQSQSSVSTVPVTVHLCVHVRMRRCAMPLCCLHIEQRDTVIALKSVRPSHAGIISKWLNILLNSLHYWLLEHADSRFESVRMLRATRLVTSLSDKPYQERLRTLGLPFFLLWNSED